MVSWATGEECEWRSHDLRGSQSSQPAGVCVCACVCVCVCVCCVCVSVCVCVCVCGGGGGGGQQQWSRWIRIGSDLLVRNSCELIEV